MRKHIFRRPVPLSQISPDVLVSDCAEQIMQLYALFVLVASKASEELIGMTFAAGKPSTQLQRIAATVLSKVAIDPKNVHFQDNYRHVTSGEVCQWLTDGEHEAWDFTAQTISVNAFASILHKETTNIVCFYNA